MHHCKKSGHLVKNCGVRRKHREELKRKKIAAALRRGSSAGEAAGATGKARMLQSAGLSYLITLTKMEIGNCTTESYNGEQARWTIERMVACCLGKSSGGESSGSGGVGGHCWR